MSTENKAKINDLDARINATKEWLRDHDLNARDVSVLKGMLCAVAKKIEDDLRQSAPAIHLAFDDRDGDPAITCTPSMNVRFKSQIERVAIILAGDMEIPEITATLGEDTASLCADAFHLSKVVREAGYEGITALRELEDDDIESIAAPFVAAERNDPEFA